MKIPDEKLSELVRQARRLTQEVVRELKPPTGAEHPYFETIFNKLVENEYLAMAAASVDKIAQLIPVEGVGENETLRAHLERSK